MKVYQIILNEAGVEPIAGRPGSYRVVYPPEYNMPPEGPLSKLEADKRLKDAEIKFRNQRAQDYLDKKEAEKQEKEKSKKPEKSSTRQSKPPPPMPEDAGKTRVAKPDWWDKATARWKNTAEYDEYIQRTVPKWIGRLSSVTVWMLKMYNILEPTYTFYTKLAQAEKDYMDEKEPYNTYEQYLKQGVEISREQADDRDMAAYNTARNYLVGEYVSKYLVVLAGYQVLARLIQLIVWAGRIKNILLFISAPVTMFASIAGAVGTQVMIGALVAFLESPEGRKWWKDYVTEIVVLGKVADSTWQGLRVGMLSFIREPALTSKEAIDKKRKEYREPQSYPPELTPDDSATDNLDKNQNANKKSSSVEKNKGQGTQQDKSSKTTSDTIVVPPKRLPKLPPASQSKVKFPSDIRAWVNGGWDVGGHPVTDGDGFLKPGVEFILPVIGARRWAKENGYPDPLADLPAAPGQTHPGPFLN